MRNRCKGRVFDHVLRLVANNYDRLRSLCISHATIRGQIMAPDDIFHEAILFIIKDKHANKIRTDDEFVKYFMYRAKMVTYQTSKDNQQEQKDEYAYYKETKIHVTDEW